MQSIKRNFTLNYKSELHITASLSLWQERFWDHVIRDADDLWHHFVYVHYNPVKHGLVDRPEDWPHSSFHFWLEQDYYDLGWGYAEPDHIKDMDLE
jgi:putative transposase